MDDSEVKDEQRLGRAAFLGVTVAGLSSLVWGRAAWEAASGILPNGVGAVLPQPTSGWRIYTVAATMPDVDPAAYRWRVEGLVRRPITLTLPALQALPVAVYDRNPAGRLVTRVTNDISSLSEMFSSGFVMIIGNFLIVVGTLAWLFVLDLRLGLIAAAVMPAMMALSSYFSGKLKDAYRIARSRLSALNAFLAENILGMRVVHLFGREAVHLRRFNQVNAWYADAQLRFGVGLLPRVGIGQPGALGAAGLDPVHAARGVHLDEQAQLLRRAHAARQRREAGIGRDRLAELGRDEDARGDHVRQHYLASTYACGYALNEQLRIDNEEPFLLRWRLISAAVILTILLTLVWLDSKSGIAGAWLLPILLVVSMLATAEVLRNSRRDAGLFEDMAAPLK